MRFPFPPQALEILSHEIQKCFSTELNSSSKLLRILSSRQTKLSTRSIHSSREENEKLLSVILVGRPNVGKSSLFNRLIRRREAIVLDTPGGHVTRDIREGIAKWSEFRFRVIDSAGLLPHSESNSNSNSNSNLKSHSISKVDWNVVLARTAKLTQTVLLKCQLILLLVDGREGLQPSDFEVAKWLRKHALSSIKILVIVNKCEGLRGWNDGEGGQLPLSLKTTVAEAYGFGFGDPIPLSAESGEGMAELYQNIHPILQEFHLKEKENEEGKQKDFKSYEKDEKEGEEEVGDRVNIKVTQEGKEGIKGFASDSEFENLETDEVWTKPAIPLQLAIAGRPNVGKSTLLNSLLGEDRVVTGPEPGLTRDSVRVPFQYNHQNIFLVDTAGWIQRAQLRGDAASSLSGLDAKKNLNRSHVVALLLDGSMVAESKCTLRRSELNLCRWILEEGRALLIVVNKMDLVDQKKKNLNETNLNETNQKKPNQMERMQELVRYAVPKELESSLQQVVNLPVVFISALKPRVKEILMPKVMETYENWNRRISTSKLNRWLVKLMARNPAKSVTGGKIRYLTQVKARPPTFIAFTSGSTPVPDSELRFLSTSLAEDFQLYGTPVRVFQRHTKRSVGGSTSR